MTRLSAVCVFCGSSRGKRPIYAEVAAAVGRTLAARNLTLVYGAGSVGLMGTVARAAIENGSRVVGVIPESLTTKELMGNPIGELLVVKTMHERKAFMASLADAYMVLPGGFGTMDELFEAITWSQLGIQVQPVGLLNVDGYFDPLLRLIDHAHDEGFIRPQHRQLVTVGTEPGQLLDQLEAKRLRVAVGD